MNTKGQKKLKICENPQKNHNKPTKGQEKIEKKNVKRCGG
jgi:hypothetical protein